MSAGKHLSDEQIAAVIDRVATGLSLKKACDQAGFNYSNILRRIRENEHLSALDMRAREDYAVMRVEAMHEVAESEPDVQRARLICDNIKWEAARVARKIYGDKVTNEHTGPNGGPIQSAHTVLDAKDLSPESRAALREALAKAKGKP